ncbi:hypothetical protein [Plesiomonas shigelloides]|uniref:hypothetical protein n=1 Tax=Plesiomonas shigelloides TaxID=703 RepID=UPI001C5B535A|nr:hypothetical protein [Plesiomonas shigelloides]MBW3792008.1 hypothetical protein [Plesiomonas shigelloides]
MSKDTPPVPATLKVSLHTLQNLQSAEYQWIRHLISEGLRAQDIEAAIMRSLGGDRQCALLLQQIALGQQPTEQLLPYFVA